MLLFCSNIAGPISDIKLTRALYKINIKNNKK